MSSQVPLITVLGSLNMDLVFYVPRHPLPGETLTASSSSMSCGGKGANQAVACAKLSRTSALTDPSVNVRMIGAVGDDTYGSLLLNNLGDYGVEIRNVSKMPGGEAATTGTAMIVVEAATGQNRIILSPGANHALRPTEFLSIPGSLPDLLILQLEIPLEVVLQAVSSAKSSGVPVLLNPAPAEPLPARVYEDLAHLVLNETEASILSSLEADELGSESNLGLVARSFLQKGVGNVVITLGERGVFYANNQGRSGLVPSLRVDVVDTTAAGDTFIGAYAIHAVTAAANQETFNIDLAVRRAVQAAAKTVSRKGAQVSIPWREELGWGSV